MPHTYEYPRPSVTVDVVVFGFDFDRAAFRVLLIRRGDEPFKGNLALPGGFVNENESLETAARRELKEETGIQIEHLEQLYTFGLPGRDPRGRVISVAYLALVRECSPEAASDAAEAGWMGVGRLDQMAFDHYDILQTALLRLWSKVRYTPVGFDLLPKYFTMNDLRRFYEAVLERVLDAANFAKKVQKAFIATGIIVKTREVQKGQHRPSPLYRFDKRAYDRAVRDNNFTFEI